MRRLKLIAAGIVLLGGCATITKGTTQIVTVSTPGVEGASCTLKSPAIGTRVVTTPARFELDKSVESVSVVCVKACYQDGVGTIASNTEAMSAGNVILGGVVGLGIDAASGAMNKYTTDNQIAMTPIPGCRARS